MDVLNLTFDDMHYMSNEELDDALSECDKMYNTFEAQYTVLKYKMEEVCAISDFLELLKKRRGK